MPDIEEAIARVIDKAFDDWQGEESEAAFVTARLSPLLNRVRAEALREAADALDATTEHLNPNYGYELAYINCTRIDAQELRHRADRIEQNSEGDET